MQKLEERNICTLIGHNCYIRGRLNKLKVAIKEHFGNEICFVTKIILHVQQFRLLPKHGLFNPQILYTIDYVL